MPVNLPQWTKDPDAVLDYTVDWVRWLDGDTIVTSEWILPAELTEVSSTHTATTATLFVSAGEPDALHRATNRITTAVGRTEDRSILLRIRDR